MKERSEITMLRGRVSPDMLDGLDKILSAYKKQRAVANFRETKKSGEIIEEIVFDRVPQKVMSRVFDEFTILGKDAPFGYALEWKITKEVDDFEFTITLSKDRSPS